LFLLKEWSTDSVSIDIDESRKGNGEEEKRKKRRKEVTKKRREDNKKKCGRPENGPDFGTQSV
jgi:hypothetical protein